MGSKYTNRYSDEYKQDVIELVRSSGRTVTAVARESGISSESLRGWVKKARAASARSATPARSTSSSAPTKPWLRSLRATAACAHLGERQLAVPAEKLPAFRKALLAQGYPLA